MIILSFEPAQVLVTELKHNRALFFEALSSVPFGAHLDPVKNRALSGLDSLLEALKKLGLGVLFTVRLFARAFELKPGPVPSLQSSKASKSLKKGVKEKGHLVRKKIFLKWSHPGPILKIFAVP